jgi:hypothetical protein
MRPETSAPKVSLGVTPSRTVRVGETVRLVAYGSGCSCYAYTGGDVAIP